MNAAPLAAANRRLRKISRSSIGAFERRSISTHSGSSTAAAARPPITIGSFQPLSPPRETPSTRPVRPTTKVLVPSTSIAAHRVGFGELAQDQPAPGGAGERERHVEPEHPVPGDRHERAAEHRAEHEADRGDHRVGAHREAEFLLGEGVGDERGGVREQERRADALQHAPHDQHGRVGGEAGAERGEREHHEAADIGALAPEQVGEAPGHQHQHGRGDQVGEDHPHEREQARVQRALEIGQRDDQRARVGRREQHPEARARQRPPLVVGVPGGDAEAGAPSGGPGRVMRGLCRSSSVAAFLRSNLT